MRDADAVVVPYTDLEQSSSSTLSMALGLGTPTVATNFRYAKVICDELPKSSACLVTEIANLSHATNMLLSNSSFANTLRQNAIAVTQGMSWSITEKLHIAAAMKAAEIFARATIRK